MIPGSGSSPGAPPQSPEISGSLNSGTTGNLGLSEDSSSTSAFQSGSRRSVRLQGKRRERPELQRETPKPKRKRVQRGLGCVEVRGSQIQGTDSAGMGIFSRAKEAGAIAFVEGERILSVEGPLALRVIRDNGKHMEWLYDSGRILGMDKSPDVIWSSLNLSIKVEGKQKLVEVGIRPENLTIYANDSVTPQQANMKCRSVYPKGLDRKPGVRLNMKDYPIRQEMIAKRDIQDCEELLWCYHNESDMQSRYAMTYVQPFNIETDADTAIQITLALIEDAGSDIEVVEDQQVFFQLRARRLLEETIIPCELTPEEISFSQLLDSGSNVNHVLKDSDRNPFALSAFMKWRAKKIGWRFGDSFPKELERLTGSGVSTIDGKPATLSVLIDFCVDKKIFNLEKGQGYFPLYWIAEKLQGEPENFAYHSLLRWRLFRVISKPNFNPVTLVNALIKTKMPNPLKENKVEWDTFDLINFTGYFGNISRGGKAVNELIAIYKNQAEYKVIPQIYMLAKFRSVEAIAAILERNLLHGNRSEFTRVSANFKRNGIYVPVNQEFVESSPESLSSFIRTYFSHSDALKMLPQKQHSEGEVLESMRGSLGARITFSKNQREEIRNTTDPVKKKEKLKAFLRTVAETSINREQVQKTLRNSLSEVGDIDGIEEPYTADSVVSLFREDKDIDWLKKIYPVRLATNKELLKKLDSPEGPVIAVQIELMKRASTDKRLLPEIIVGFKKVWHTDDNGYFRDMSKKFNSYSIIPERGESWSAEAVRVIYTQHCQDSGTKVVAFSTLSDDEWVSMRSSGQGSRKAFGEHFLSAIKNACSDEDKLDLVRRYMRATYRNGSISFLSDLLSRLNQCDDIPGVSKPYSSGTLVALFKEHPDDLQWLKKLSTEFWTNEELLNGLREGNKPKAAKAELMRRAATDKDLRMKVLILSRTLTTMKDAGFFSDVAKQYKRHQFSPPCSGEWDKKNVAEFYQKAYQNFPTFMEELSGSATR